jgi:Ca-activated chloride channel homolog
VAAARPQWPNESRRKSVEGIAIQMVLDISSSMLDQDLSPPGRSQTRLDVVKDVFRRFVLGGGDLSGRPNDLVGMICFARYPDSVCPLTLDRDVLAEAVDATRTVIFLDPTGRWRGSREEDGTAIGDGLALAVERLKDLKRTTGSGNQLVINSRVVILLTDGENNAGLITPEQAGELAALYGIKVYTILAGTGQRVNDFFSTRLPVDDSALRRIAEVTGGKFFRSGDAQGLEKIYEAIDQLERTKTEEHSYVEWGELGWPLLVTAFAAVAAQTLLGATLLRKLP